MDQPNGRRPFLTGLAASAVSACMHDPQGSRPPRVGFLISEGFPSLTAAFRGELRTLGYVEGKNLILEMRLARGNTGDSALQAAELAGMDLDLIVAASLPVALLVRARNPAMPLVIATGPNLVGNGFARSLRRPGGVTTGSDELAPGLTGRRLRLLKATAPGVSRVALLSTTRGVGAHEIQTADAVAAARRLGITVAPYRATTLPELRDALDRIGADRMDGLVNFQGALSLINRDLVIDLARRRRLPAIYQSRLFVEAGGLMAWAPDQDEQFRQAARYAHRILKGARPGDLPIHHPDRYFLTLSLSAAREIGVTPPREVLARADAILP